MYTVGTSSEAHSAAVRLGGRLLGQVSVPNCGQGGPITDNIAPRNQHTAQ